MSEIEDQYRLLTISDLAALQNDPIVGCCVHWEDVGLQIGLKKSDIDTIKKNQHFQVEDCRREMLSKFLQNNNKYELSLNDLHKIVNRIKNKHAIQENSDQTKEEEKKAVAAVGHLERLLEDWERRNENIAADMKELNDEFKEEKEWIDRKTEKWNREESEWQQGENEKIKRKIQMALKAGDYKSSVIVQELFQNKDLQLSQLSDRAVECILRQDLTEIDLDRLSTMKPDYKQMKKHQTQLEQLNNDINAFKKLLDERIRAYDKIKNGLRSIGVKNEKLRELTDQLERLRGTVRECEIIKRKCQDAFQEGRADFEKWTRELNTFVKSLHDNVQNMQKWEPEFIRALYAFFGLAGGAAAGAVGGGVIGTVLIPVPILGTLVGTGIGTVVGGLSGLVWSAAKADEGRAKVESNVRNYRETVSKAQEMHHDLYDLLND